MAQPAAIDRVAIIGAGAWGTALAILAARAGRETRLLARSRAHAVEMQDLRENARRLPGRAFPEGLSVTDDAEEALAGAQAVLLVTPSQTLRETCARLHPHAAPDALLIACAKGVERGTGLLMTQVAEQAAPGRDVAALSGPSFAGEAADGLPTAVLIACAQVARARAACAALAHGAFRPYAGGDAVGAELGGAAKNVIAIACGAAEGLGLGANARAALVSRGLAEIGALGAAMGARPETVAGLAGLGDLVLTCTSPRSRNMSFGIALGQAGSMAALAEARGALGEGGAPLAEGAENAASVTDLARAHGVEMPICETVRAVLEGRFDLGEAIAALMARPLRVE
ncbi:NAD(P)H-dependent glycerol-3-phosphate dehydrogenase [Rhodovulum sp. DZ06]|uniref:NAD(P)H-dependent glycerol-3-phosphate dehydrogenase n=1 Tax=Rhodovulum sp. DZ06 TaxID=3425126 RepID=UPI003D330D52